jgi:HNH endonuclease/AP2 domain
MTPLITAERLREILHYAVATGIFNGALALPTESAPVIRLGSDIMHRLAWLYMTTAWAKEVDHVNGVKDDNRFANLREVTRQQNSANSRAQSNNRIGLKGVSWHKHNRKYRAVIHVNGRQITLGYFDTPERAWLTCVLAARNISANLRELKLEA